VKTFSKRYVDAPGNWEGLIKFFDLITEMLEVAGIKEQKEEKRTERGGGTGLKTDYGVKGAGKSQRGADIDVGMKKKKKGC